MNNKEKIRVKLTLPGEDTKKYTCDFVMASLIDDHDGKRENYSICCGTSNTHALIKAWTYNLVTTLMNITQNVKLRSALCDFAIFKLKETIKEIDPDAIDQDGNLRTLEFAKEFLKG